MAKQDKRCSQWVEHGVWEQRYDAAVVCGSTWADYVQLWMYVVMVLVLLCRFDAICLERILVQLDTLGNVLLCEVAGSTRCASPDHVHISQGK